MAKKKVSERAMQIRKLLVANKLVVGAERTVKALRNGKLSEIMVSATCADSTIERLDKYAKFSGVNVKKLRMPSDELGVVCKKPFAISVLGVLKGK
ncbi:hypothetical protein GF358_03650 [Candidatus Woesearchaeota archaeon]|nr:hypothetical protein [Candidatus Woesearchaeota archaeon]